MSLKTNNSMERSWQFMLNEYNSMQSLREIIINQTEGRVSMYLKIVAAFVAITPACLAFVTQEREVPFCIGAMVIVIIVLGFGVLSFYRVMEGHISIIRYARAANRARRFFWDNDEEIREYVSMPITDDTPSFGTYGFSSVKTTIIGATSLVIILNTINFALVGVLLVLLLHQLEYKSCIPLVSVLTLGLTIVYYINLQRIYNKRMQEATNQAEIKYPSK